MPIDKFGGLLNRVLGRRAAASETVVERLLLEDGQSPAQPIAKSHVDDQGRVFNFLHVSRPHTGRLLIHFAATLDGLGERNDARAYLENHCCRLPVFGDAPDYGSLFLWDEFGPSKKGTHYIGEKGDCFVEEAVKKIITDALERDTVDPSNVVMIGASMGATGALKFGLEFDVGAIVAISPHIDLDSCGSPQWRMDHVAHIVRDGDPTSTGNFRYTRQITTALAERDTSARTLPRLYLHACIDDCGYYREQVRPLADRWRAKGGDVDLDIRPEVGHASDFVVGPLLQDVVLRLFRNEPIEPLRYRQDRTFWPRPKAADITVGGSADISVASPSAVDLAAQLASNAEMTLFGAEFIADRAFRNAGTLPLIVFYGAIDDAVMDAIRGNADLEGVEVCSLQPSANGSRQDGQLIDANGETRSVASEERPLVLILDTVFYDTDRISSQERLLDLPATIHSVLLIDQIDNWDGVGSQIMRLEDGGGRSYEVRCLDFRNLLKKAGFVGVTAQPLPQPIKSRSGLIFAEKGDTLETQEVNDATLERQIVEFFYRWQAFDIRRYRGQQAGQFVIPNCAAGGMRIRAFLRNTRRNDELFPIELRELGIAVELRVFRKGHLVFHDPHFARIPYDGLQEISDATCAALQGDQSDILIVARCFLPSDGATYFGQEHQLCYEHAETGGSCSVLYDQLPVTVAARPYAPIVLLAPKAWVGETVNTYVTFASTDSSLQQGMQDRLMEVTVFDRANQPVLQKAFEMPTNSALVFDVRNALADAVEITEKPRFFNVVAKGGESSFAIVTFVVNQVTGNFALEHSLSPHYYVSGDLRRVREDSLRFAGISRR